MLTDPVLAAEFVKETNVDFLAAAIGTVHGLYVSKPNIDLSLLEQIRERVAIPLVLHGGSDTPDHELRQVIERGITKININTDISVEAMKFLKGPLDSEKYPHLSFVMEDMQKVMESRMAKMVRLFKG